MGFDAAITGISSDVSGLARAFGPVGVLLLIMTFALPVASLLVALRRSRLALVPLAGSVMLLAAWVLYYALGWWSVEAGVVIPAFGAVILGWVVLLAIMWRSSLGGPEKRRMGGRVRTRVGIAVLLLAVLLALPFGVAWGRTLGGEAVVGHPAVAGFQQSAEVDRDRYEEQDTVVLTYRACRSRPWQATTNSPGRGSLAVEFRVLNDRGDVVADSTHQGHVLVLVLTRWWPGQCRSMDVTWDQRYWNQHPPDEEEQRYGGQPIRRDRVEPGTYRFEVSWQVSPDDEPDDQLPEPIETAPFVLEP